MLCYVMLCYVMLCYVMLCYVMLCYVMLCYVMLCYVMLCYVMLCYVMLCYVMLCYVMLCYVMLCYVLIFCYFYILRSVFKGQEWRISNFTDSEFSRCLERSWRFVYIQVLPVGLFSYLLLARSHRKHVQGASGCRYTAHAWSRSMLRWDYWPQHRH